MGQIYKCDWCGKFSESTFSLETHIDRVHGKEKYFACDICGRRFKYKSYLYGHKQMEHRREIAKQNQIQDRSQKPFGCVPCSKSFQSHEQLGNHMRNHGKNSIQYPKCEVCNKHFTTKDKLLDHKRSANHYVQTPIIDLVKEYPYACGKCDKSFKTDEQLSIHLKRQCEAQSNVQNHKLIAQNGTKRPFVCKICKLMFPSIQILRNHIRTCFGKRGYKCKICDKTFTTRSFLENHIMQTHIPFRDTKANVVTIKDEKRHDITNKLFKCDICDQTFQKQNALNHHIKFEHENPSKTPDKFSEERAFIKDVKPKSKDVPVVTIVSDQTKQALWEKYVEENPTCNPCGTKFPKQSGLRTHQGKMSDIKCDVCDQQCCTKNNLKNHIKSFHKSYKCAECETVFPSSQEFEIHVKELKKEPQAMKCTLCLKTVCTKKNLEAHKRLAHSFANLGLFSIKKEKNPKPEESPKSKELAPLDDSNTKSSEVEVGELKLFAPERNTIESLFTKEAAIKCIKREPSTQIFEIEPANKKRKITENQSTIEDKPFKCDKCSASYWKKENSVMFKISIRIQ